MTQTVRKTIAAAQLGGWSEQSVPTQHQTYSFFILIGELYRRIGQIELANIWFDRAIEASENQSDGEAVRRLAERQKHEPRDEM